MVEQELSMQREGAAAVLAVTVVASEAVSAQTYPVLIIRLLVGSGSGGNGGTGPILMALMVQYFLTAGHWTSTGGGRWG